MKSGDLLFFKPGHFDYAGRLVAWYTGGPYCHIEVAISDTESIGALAQGVVRHAASVADAVASPQYNSDGLKAGLDWLEKQVGDPYGVFDLADAALGRMFKHLPLLFLMPGTYDCSALSTNFLNRAGVKLPSDLAKTPSIVSPNDLARVFGVIQ